MFRFLYLREKHFSLTGLVLVALWAGLSLFVFILDGFTGALFVDRPDLFEYNYYLGLVVTVVSFLFYGPAIAAFSVSAIKAKVFASWLNWLGIAIGAFTILGYVSGAFGLYMVYSPIFPVYAGIATLRSLFVGIQLMGKKLELEG